MRVELGILVFHVPRKERGASMNSLELELCHNQREGAALTWPMKGLILMAIPDHEEEAPASVPPSWERGVEGA